MTKVIVFDMDGTIFDFYGVNGWLEDLHNENTRPYDLAEFMYTIELIDILNQLRELGWLVGITSWLAKDSSQEYKKATRESKKNRLAEINFPCDFCHLVQYGTRKDTCTKNLGGFQILVDDNAEVRESWRNGATIDANKNILEELKKLLDI